MPPVLKAMRPVQWVKNVFVLAPLVFAEQLLEPALLLRAGFAFLAFCWAASAIYLVNDLRDRDDDRKHPLKKHRPIASGALSVGAATGAAIGLAAAALGLSLYLGTNFALLLGTYLTINFAYSNGLKRVVILDVMAVSSGYVIRVMAGAAAIDVGVSQWLLLCTTFLALFLIFSKRRHELILLADSASGHRSVLSHYSPTFLDQMINVVTASTVVSYSLYCVDESTIERFGSERLVFTLPMVLYGIFRYLYLIYQRPEERNPTEALLSDWPFVLNVAIWGLVVLWVVYL
ncbi:MAG: decaprenyl-phosphate phosphoribosyltransferase [Acidobacteriota bacterium]